MEPAVDKLEALFQKAESDLNFVSLKLDSELSQQFSESGQDELNPIKLLERLNQVKRQFKQMLEDAANTYSQQQELKTALSNQLLCCNNLLHQLQDISGLPGLEQNEEQEGFLASIIQTNTETRIPEQVASDSEDKENNVVHVKHRNAQQPGCVTKSVGRSSKGFLPVSEEEFLAVSDLVRRRVRLHDVNKVYEVLYDHFKKNESSLSLTPQEMTKMGLKISGATGQAKLKVLRALKIIVMNNNGAVKMTA